MWRDLLTAYVGQEISYDGCGNPVSYYDGSTFTWTQGRRLAGYANGDTDISYAYDMAGVRSSKTVNGTEYRFTTLSGLVTRQEWDGNSIDFVYDENNQPLAMKYNGTLFYYVLDLQGDVAALADQNGTLIAKYTYDPWGKLLKVTPNGWLEEQNAYYLKVAEANPLRYRGYYYDSETGFYYLQSRYYDPEIGRWINADNAIAGVGGDIRGYNLFTYCMNDPVNMSDHTGHWPQWIKNAASAVVNAVKKVVNVVANTVKSAVSSASNILKASSNSLPKKGEPGSSQTLPNPDGTPKQKRWYGPDGNPERDRDYNHPGNMPFPHDHEWKNGERGKEHLPPDPSYKMSWEPVIGAGLVVICTVGIIAVAADDLTGVGVADDFLFGPLGAGVGEGLIMIFG